MAHRTYYHRVHVRLSGVYTHVVCSIDQVTESKKSDRYTNCWSVHSSYQRFGEIDECPHKLPTGERIKNVTTELSIIVKQAVNRKWSSNLHRTKNTLTELFIQTKN